MTAFVEKRQNAKKIAYPYSQEEELYAYVCACEGIGEMWSLPRANSGPDYSRDWRLVDLSALSPPKSANFQWMRPRHWYPRMFTRCYRVKSEYEGGRSRRRRSAGERREEERGESGFESLPTTRRDTCGRENLLRLWKARKWRGLLSLGTRSLSRTCRKVRAKPLLASLLPLLSSWNATHPPLVNGEWWGRVYLLLVAETG